MNTNQLPVGTQTLIFSKLYYGVLTKSLEHLEAERYFSILVYLQACKKCCQQKICNDLMIDKTAMVKVLDYLRKLGYIQKQTNPEDRREHFISLSKKGELAAKDIQKSVKMIEKKILSGLSCDELNTFSSVLNRVTDNMKAMPFNDLFFNYKRTRK
jgi:MarR family transcriptional regulator, transcriptional regulator for hemolysin